MKTIHSKVIRKAVADGYRHICCNLDGKVTEALASCRPKTAAEAFSIDIMIENARLASAEDIPVCQDTGMAVVFIEIGQDVVITGEYLEDAVNAGVREAYKRFRKSILSPIGRKNTGDNTPAVIHTTIVKGDKIKLSLMAKGFGSENMSRVYMLNPADGVQGIKQKIVQTIKEAGGCPCPPVIVGVGIGGDFEKCALMSKHALFRQIGSTNPDTELARLETEVLEELNKLGIGAQGYGGDLTALAVFIEQFPTHIAGLPLGVAVQCHASRHIEIVLEGV